MKAGDHRALSGKGIRRAGLALAAAAGLIGLMPLAVQAEVTSFNALAVASAVRFTTIADNAPVSERPIDGPGPTASAAMDGLGTRRAFASFPYPGDGAVDNVSVIPAVVPIPASVSYPLYVRSDHPVTPKAEQTLGPVTMTAETTDRSATARGSTAPSDGPVVVSTLTADASVTRGDEGVSSAAQSTGRFFSAGPVSIVAFSSQATAVLDGTGTLSRSSKLDVSGLRIGETAVEVSSKGLTGPGGAPLAPEQQAQLRAALGQAGFTVDFLPAREYDGGVVSAGLQIRQARQFANGEKGFSWVVGQVVAEVRTTDAPSPEAGGALLESPAPTDSPVIPADPPPALVSTPADAPPTRTAVGRPPTTAVAAPEVLDRGPDGGGELAVPVTPPPRSVSVQAPAVARSAARHLRGGGPYVGVLVSGFIAVLLAVGLVSFAGVRQSWGS